MRSLPPLYWISLKSRLKDNNYYIVCDLSIYIMSTFDLSTIPSLVSFLRGIIKGCHLSIRNSIQCTFYHVESDNRRRYYYYYYYYYDRATPRCICQLSPSFLLVLS